MGAAVQRSPEPAAGDETLSLLRDSVQAFARARGGQPLARGWRGREPGHDPEAAREMAELGWFGLLAPEEVGGSDLGFAAMSVILETLGASLLAEPLTATAVLAGRVLQRLERSPARDELLTGLAAGDRLCALAGTNLGCDVAASRSEDGSWRLDGRTGFVAGGGANDFLVLARAGDQLGCFWIVADATGLRQVPARRPDGGLSIDLTLTGVEAGLLGAGPIVTDAVEAATDEARVMICAELVGVIRAVMDMTVEYLGVRQQYGRLIGSFQALQHKAVDLLVQKELAVAVLEEAVTALDVGMTGVERARVVSRAKARCSDAALRITREAIQLHGAIGYTDEHDLGLFVKRALVLSAWLGNGAENRRRFARLRP